MTTENQLDKELPISLDDLQKQKTAMWSISTDIGRVIEITPEIWEILGVYQESEILVRKIEILGHNLFKVEFTFPEYKLLNKKLGHVSIVQMQLALVQGLVMAFGVAVKQNELNSPISYETYLLNRDNVLYRRDEKTMRKKLNFNEKCYLIFKLHPVIKKGRDIYSITTDIIRDKNTFLDGRVESVLQDEYLFDEREKANFKDIKNNQEVFPNTMAGNVLTRFEANNNIKETMAMTDFADKDGNITDTKEEEK